MNHIRLLIRNQCGSHIIHGLPNPLAFQQNYSCYDGPSESGIFSPLDEPLLTSYLRVFEKFAYKVGIFHKKLAECVRFMRAVLIEFSLRHPGSLHEPSLTEGQSSERDT